MWREDNGKKDNEFNFGCVKIKVHGLFSWLMREAVGQSDIKCGC